MLCLLRLHGELALRAKGVLLLRESGMEDRPSTMRRGTNWRNSSSLNGHRPNGNARAATDDAGDRQGHLAVKAAEAIKAIAGFRRMQFKDLFNQPGSMNYDDVFPRGDPGGSRDEREYKGR